MNDGVETERLDDGSLAEEESVPDFKLDRRCSLLEADESSLVRVRVLDLHPTQLAVGMQQVGVKKQMISEMINKPKKLEKFLVKNPLPAVRGPGNTLYITDHHHLSSALVQLEIEEAYANVQKDDWSNMSVDDFWARMHDEHFLCNYDEQGQAVEWQDVVARLPRDVRGLKDDPYRSLAAIVRKNGGYDKDWTPFAEFEWANYFRSRIPLDQDDPAHEMVVNAAVEWAKKDDAAHLPGYKPPV